MLVPVYDADGFVIVYDIYVPEPDRTFRWIGSRRTFGMALARLRRGY